MNGIYAEVELHALEAFPGECCGVVVGDDIVIRSRNLSASPEDTYVIDPRVMLTAEGLGGVRYIYHSHTTGGPQPSDVDREACTSFGVPMLIFAVDGKRWHVEQPKARWSSLLASTYTDKDDCLQLVVDYYWQVHSVLVKVSDRPESYEFDADPFGPRSAFSGFYETSSPELPGDVVTLCWYRTGGSVPNHLGVMVGDNRMLHRPAGGICCISDLTKAVRRRIATRYRHEALA